MNEEKSFNLYEIGYLVIPTLSEDKIGGVMADIRKYVEKAGGEVKTEELPKLRRLAYTMRKKQETVYEKYDTAYFGYTHFTAEADAVAAIKEGVDGNNAVLRYLIIKDPNTERIADADVEETLEIASEEVEAAPVEEVAPEAEAAKEEVEGEESPKTE